MQSENALKEEQNNTEISAELIQQEQPEDLPNPSRLYAESLTEEGFWLESVPDETYHSDRDRVSSSQLRLIATSPATFLAGYQGLLKVKDTHALRLGRLIHKVVLEGGEAVLEEFACIPAHLYRSWGHANSNRHKAAKAAWYAEHEGKTVVKPQELDQLRSILDAVANHKDAALLLTDGAAELSGFYTDPETGIQCRIRPDFVNTRINGIIDLKSVTECNPAAFQRSVVDWLYHFQLGMYGAGYEEIEGSKPEFYAFIAVEKQPPYEVAVYVADETMIRIGQEDYRDCLQKLRQCIDSGSWPTAYPSILNLSLPAWLLKQRS